MFDFLAPLIFKCFEAWNGCCDKADECMCPNFRWKETKILHILLSWLVTLSFKRIIIYRMREREKSNPYNMTHLKQYLWYSPCQPKHSPKHHLLLHKIPIHFMCVLPLKNRQCNLSHFITTSILFIHSFSNQWLLPKTEQWHYL